MNPYREQPASKFIQIASNNETLYALDADGIIWFYAYDDARRTNGWYQKNMKRGTVKVKVEDG